MQFGANTQIWVAPFTQNDLGLIDKVAGMGFDMIELGYASDEPPFKVADVKERLKAHGMIAGVCSFLPGDRDIATAITSVVCAQGGVWGVRVHDVAGTRDAFAVLREVAAHR